MLGKLIFFVASCAALLCCDARAADESFGQPEDDVIRLLDSNYLNTHTNPQEVNLLTSSFPAEGNVAQFEVFSNSTEGGDLPKKGVKTHNPANSFAFGISGAPSYPRDFDMFLDLNRALRTSTLSLAIGGALAGCGGGGSGASDESTASAAPIATATSSTGAASATSTTTASADATGVTEQATGAYSSVISVGTSAATDSTPVQTASAAPDTTIALAAIGTDVATLASTAASSQPAAGGGKSSTAAATARAGVGVNVGTMDTYSPEYPTIDLMKRAGNWFTGCMASTASNCQGFTGGATAFSTLEESKLDLDANGWVRSLPAANDTTVKYRYVSTVLSSGTAPNGTYIVKYDGSGTLTYSGVATKVAAQSTAGRDVVQVANSSTGGIFMTIKATTPGNYLRNIRVYPPGGACANDYTTFAADASVCTGTKGAFVAFESFPASKPWYPPFFHDLKGFRTLRFMDWARTNSTSLSAWAQRPLPTDRTWTSANGVPIESMIQLSNDIGADPWMNLSPYVTDDYVHQFAKLVHQQLASTHTLNLEYANEPWNYAFAATKWMQAQSAALWPAEIAKGTDVYVLQTNWYGRRLAQVCNIVKGEFGADASRVRCIANSQSAGSWMTKQTLACTYAAAELGKPCGKFYDAVAIAPYFGSYVPSPKLRPIVSAWYQDADGGLSKMFQELTGADASGLAVAPPLLALASGAPKGALSQVKDMMVATKAVLDAYGLPMWAYEGGQSLVVYPGDTDPKIGPLILAANRDARMGAAYTQHLADWKAAGGQTYAFYNHTFVPSKYGTWGLKENLMDDAAPKWQAVVKARDGSACWWSGC